jgi:hypothetical protein
MFTDVSEVLAASIIRAMSIHHPDDGGRLHSVTAQKTAIFILTTIGTENLTCFLRNKSRYTFHARLSLFAVIKILSLSTKNLK